MMLTLVKPAFDDLWFREKLMADEETMSYDPISRGCVGILV